MIAKQGSNLSYFSKTHNDIDDDNDTAGMGSSLFLASDARNTDDDFISS